MLFPQVRGGFWVSCSRERTPLRLHDRVVGSTRRFSGAAQGDTELIIAPALGAELIAKTIYVPTVLTARRDQVGRDEPPGSPTLKCPCGHANLFGRFSGRHQRHPDSFSLDTSGRAVARADQWGLVPSRADTAKLARMSESGGSSRPKTPHWPPVVEVDGEAWRVCPVGGPGCCRVRNDAGQMALDVIEVHVQVSHGLPSWLSGVGQVLTPPPDQRGAGDKLWTRKRGA